MDPDSALALLNTKVNWAGSIAFIVYLLHSGVKYYLDWRDARKVEADREALVTAVATLTEAVRGMGVSDASINKLLVGLAENDVKMRETMNEMVLRLSGGLDKEASLHLVDKFFADFARDAGSIFTYSLENNGYLERPDFIRDRVKTQLAQSLESQRSALNYFKMALNVDPFFEVREIEHKERFVLVDDLWAAVEPLYTSPRSITARCEEMRLITQNLIKDYLTKTKKKASNTPLPAG